MTNSKNNYQFLRGVAWVSAVFGLVVCILVIANYFQSNRIDPVNTEIINSLVQRLNENPDDQQLRIQIQELDLLARKAYFTNQWQVKTGGYLVLMALAIFVIAYQIMDAGLKKQVQPNEGNPQDILGIQKNARLGIALVGGGLVFIALLLAFLTHHKLGLTLNNNAIASNMNENLEKVKEEVADAVEIQAETIVEVEETAVEEEFVKEKLPVEKAEVSKAIQASNDNIEKAVKQELKPASSSIPSVEELKRNFTAFRGYNGNGIVYQKNIPTAWNGIKGENILWKSPIPVQGYNSPIIWDNKVFLTGATESVREVFCYDRLSGKLLWRTKVEGIDGSPAASPKTTPDTGLAAATMTTDGRRVYAIFGNGDLMALDMDGKKVWALNLGVPQNHYGHSSSLIMYKDKLIIQYDQKTDSKLMALAAASGKTIWSTPRKVKISWASPIIINQNNKAEIILVADPIVASYNPETGKENWQLDCIYGEVGPSAAYADGIVYALNEYAKLAAISLENPTELLWENDEILSDIPSPLAANGLLLVVASYGALACYDAVSGEMYWDHEFDNNVFASPMLVGDNVYLLDKKGIMHIFKMDKTFKSIADLPLGEDAVTTPAFADGHIYIRTDKNLYCIGK